MKQDDNVEVISSSHEPTSVHSWSDKDLKVVVEQPHGAGFWCTLKMIARIRLAPDKVFAILTDPENEKKGIFRNVKGTKFRNILEDDGHGLQKIESEQLAKWRLGPFSGTFSIRLVITQNKRNNTIHFDLAHPYGFMKAFAGTWTIRPFKQDDIDELVNYPGKHWGPVHAVQKALHNFEDRLSGKHNDISLVQLEQSVAPALVPPPPLDRVLKKIAATQIRCIMEDLQAEVERINAGQPSTVQPEPTRTSRWRRKRSLKSGEEGVEEKTALDAHIYQLKDK